MLVLCIVTAIFENIEFKKVRRPCDFLCQGGGCLFANCDEPAHCPGGNRTPKVINNIPLFLSVHTHTLLFSSGACDFISAVEPTCSGGGCRFTDCSKATCSGGGCNFENPKDSLRIGYCNGNITYAPPSLSLIRFCLLITTDHRGELLSRWWAAPVLSRRLPYSVIWAIMYISEWGRCMSDQDLDRAARMYSRESQKHGSEVYILYIKVYMYVIIRTLK